MTTLQLSIEDLESIIKIAKIVKKSDASLSSTLKFELFKTTDSHTSSDKVMVDILSSYQECNGVSIW